MEKKINNSAPKNVDKEQVSLDEHNDLIKRICQKISALFEPTKVAIHEVKVSEKILNRSAAEVLSRPPRLRTAGRSNKEMVISCEGDEKELTVAG